MIIGPDGQILAQAEQEPTLITAPLDATVVDQQRSRFFPAGERTWTGQDREKIVSFDQLQSAIAQISRHGSRFSLATGDFTRIEVEQVEQLEQARSQSEGLVVGILDNGDPPTGSADQQKQARILAALGCVGLCRFVHGRATDPAGTTIQPNRNYFPLRRYTYGNPAYQRHEVSTLSKSS